MTVNLSLVSYGSTRRTGAMHTSQRLTLMPISSFAEAKIEIVRLEGDLVAVELLDVDEVWGQKREKEEKKKRKDNSDPRGGSIAVNDAHHAA